VVVIVLDEVVVDGILSLEWSRYRWLSDEFDVMLDELDRDRGRCGCLERSSVDVVEEEEEGCGWKKEGWINQIVNRKQRSVSGREEGVMVE
jgi:hypothetical protein